LRFDDYPGQDLLRESLFVKCILKVTSEREGFTRSTLDGSFDYMFFYHTNCTSTVEGVVDHNCGSKIGKMMGIDI